MSAVEQPALVAPGPELTIMHAEAQRQALLAALLAHPDGFDLDLGGVQQMDTTGVQILLALRASLARRGQPMRVQAASATTRDVLQTYGLQSLLGTP